MVKTGSALNKAARSFSGVTQQAISKIEQGERKSPQIDTLAKLATALKCTVDDLIEDDEKGRSA